MRPNQRKHWASLSQCLWNMNFSAKRLWRLYEGLVDSKLQIGKPKIKTPLSWAKALWETADGKNFSSKVEMNKPLGKRRWLCVINTLPLPKYTNDKTGMGSLGNLYKVVVIRIMTILHGWKLLNRFRFFDTTLLCVAQQESQWWH